MLILAGDIGGTRSRLRALDYSNQMTPVVEAVYASASYASLSDIILDFSQKNQIHQYAYACLGLPGPINQRRVNLTNLPWLVDADQLEANCAIKTVQFINDFQAAAYGIDTLSNDQLITLQMGQFNAKAHRLVVGAGTGLGVSPVVFEATGFKPQASEAGHMDFAPMDANQAELLKWLWPVWSHVSYERILSGAGLETLYAFYAGLSQHNHQAWLKAEVIQQLAEQGDLIAHKTIQTFVEVYGAYIGNLILLWPSYGGVYIAGGIAGKIEVWMKQNGFLDALRHKGRMRDLVQKTPVYLVVDESLGLHGASNYARLAVNGQRTRLKNPCPTFRP
ncbi:MAG: glucokinase [Thiomicrospira sp.]|uniref:glucokinase n=1 Tax=Thiomicrospira sp. TaxID=935 RepID=UPI001A07069F|nr:glucokinase [Thiomicrospira sp.]MBE0493791.1 glucokinase [Thiomicrospira sp.]